MAKGRPWTASEEDELRIMRALGMSYKECAVAMGRSEKSILHKLYDKKEHFVRVKERGRNLTGEALEKFIQLYPTTINNKLQLKFGISFGRLHKLAREHGLKKTTALMKKTQLAASAAAAKSHRLNGTYPPKGYIIPKSRENGFKKGETSEMRIGKEREKERIKKITASLALRRKREKALVFCGLPQKTKLRVIAQGYKKTSYRYGLRKNGYIQDPNDHDHFFYPIDGHRCPRREKNGAKYGIRFSDASKVRSDELNFETMVQTPVPKPKKRPMPIEDPFGRKPVSTSIVRDLGAYSNEMSYSYDKQ